MHMAENREGVDIQEAVAVAVGGALGAVAGATLGRAGTVVGAVIGGVIADGIVEATQQPAPNLAPVFASTAREMERLKNDLVAVMNQIPSPTGRTVCQMAINALNHSAVECRTAAGQQA